MRPRILLHPGFHKTGTSSVQHFLWANRKALRPHVSVLLLRHLMPAAKICMQYATTGNPLVLADLAETLDEIFSEHSEIGERHLVMSCEGLSGHLPGWPEVESYSAAPITAGYLAGYLDERFPEHDLCLLYTLRDTESWLYSAWRHHLIGQRMTLDHAAFSERYRGAADFTPLVERIRVAVSPAPVETLSLEEAAAHPSGPGGALLDRLPLPGDLPLVPVGRGNQGPDAALSQRLLELNRSDLGPTTLKAEKTHLVEAAGVGGWVWGNGSD